MKKRDAQRGPALSVHPTELRVGDRFRDETGEWEVVGRPVSKRGGKDVHVRVQRPGDASSLREAIWPAHERSR